MQTLNNKLNSKFKHKLFLISPLIGVIFMLTAAVLQKLSLGVDIFPIKGYIAPLTGGLLGGILVAFWFYRSQKYLLLAVKNAKSYEKLNYRHETLLQSIGEGIIGLDNKGFCTFINQSALNILGFERKELVDKNVHNLIHHSSQSGIKCSPEECLIQQSLLMGLEIEGVQDVFWHKDGSPIEVNYSARPLQEIGGDAPTGAVILFRDITEKKEMEDRIFYISNYDPLTGLFNRQSFEKHLGSAVESSQFSEITHILCYIDINQFKIINDTAGHEAGDHLLGELAKLLSGKKRQGDILGRLGGDEFGLLLRQCPVEVAERIVKTILAEIDEFRFTWQTNTSKINLSFGLFAIDQATVDATIALQNAHRACLLAKDMGLNKYRIFDLNDKEFHDLHRQMTWVSRINSALDDNRLFLRYQNIEPIPTKKKSMNALEILIAMKDENGNTVSPGGFLPAAERYGLINSIDRWVLSNALNWLSRHPEHYASLDFISINLAGPSFSDEEFLCFVQSELEKSKVPSNKICFEITETAAIRNLPKAGAFMRDLRRLGCRFSLDDFGSGMSSFGYLKNLPIDCIKIDGSFVRDAVRSPLARAIVESIHNVSRSVGALTIAEMAEDEETVKIMEEIGIDYIQGFVIHRPQLLDMS